MVDMKIPRRSLITGSTALVTLAAMREADAANVPFTTFDFKATGAPTARTMPDRLAEVKNVLDFGADPTGGNPSTNVTAIQAAVDWTTGPDRGTIYFPAGSYQTNAPITFNYIGLTAVNSTGSSYNSGTGIVTLNLTTTPTYTPFCSVTVSGLTGTGAALSQANGIFMVLSVSGTVITYAINTGLTISTITGGAVVGNLSIRFLGDNTADTAIFGNFSGYILDRSLGSPNNTTGGRIFERLNVLNGRSPGQGSIRVGSSDGVVVRDCFLSAYTCFTSEDSAGASSTNITLNNIGCTGGSVAGSRGFVVGGGGFMTACTCVGADIACTIYGKGFNASGNRWERNNTATLLGVDTGTAATFQGTVSAGVLTASSVSGSILLGQMLYDGGVSVPAGVTIQKQLTGSAGGAGTYSLYSGQSFTISSPISMSTIGNQQATSGFSITGASNEGDWVGMDLAGPCSAFIISSIFFLGHPASNSGAIPNLANTQFGLLVRDGMASSGVFSGLGTGQWADVAAAAVGTMASRANLLFNGCNMVFQNSAGSGVNWIPPNNAYSAQFVRCNEQPIWTFSQLPRGSDLFVGDEFNIRDSNTATWGATAAGSGSNHVLVRWNNGTAWTVVAQ